MTYSILKLLIALNSVLKHLISLEILKAFGKFINYQTDLYV